MKKILLATACFALMLSSCVKNFESESVTAMRDAQKELLISQTAVNNAQAAATALLAEADAAIKKAQAEALAVETAIREVQKQLLEVQLESAKADLELKLAELEAKKAALAAQMEEAAVWAEKALIDAKNALEASKKTYLDTLAGVEAAKAARLALLFGDYTQAVQDLIAAKADVVTKTADLVAAEKGLVTAEELRDKILADNEKTIAEKERSIAIEEKRIELINSYSEMTVEEAKAKYDEAHLELEALQEETVKATKAANEVSEEIGTKLGWPENHEFNLAINEFEAILSYYDYEIYETVLPQKEIDGETWWGYYVVADEADPKTGIVAQTFVPLVCAEVEYAEPVRVTYNIESTAAPQYVEYEPVVSLGKYDAKAINEYVAYLEEHLMDEYSKGEYGWEAQLEQAKKDLVDQEAYEPALKALLESAVAWKPLYEDYVAKNKNANELTTDEVISFDPIWGNVYAPSAFANYLNAKEAYDDLDKAIFDLQDEIINLNIQLKKDNEAVSDTDLASAIAVAESVLETAQSDYEDAYKKYLAATEEDYDTLKETMLDKKDALDTAKENLDNLNAEKKQREEKAAETKADLEEAKATLTELEAELETAKTALDDAEKVYNEAVVAYEEAKAKYEEACLAFETLYEENADAHVKYHTYDYVYYGYEMSGIIDVDVLRKHYTMFLEALDATKEQIETLGSYIAGDDESVKEDIANATTPVKDLLAKLEALEPSVKEYVDAYNAANKKLYEELIPAQDIAQDRENLKNAELTALNAALTDAETRQGQLDGCQTLIDGYKEDIKGLKTQNEQVSNLATQEQAIETAKTRLEFAQVKVEFYQARADEAKAAWEAAEQE